MLSFDVIVLGAGHAGCEAALASSRIGLKTLCLTLNLDSIALMPCNPCIGGTSKGHLVREIDALGGEMGLAADECAIQARMLNTAKGPAVHSLRAQIDKRRYHERMKRALELENNLILFEGECKAINAKNGTVYSITTDDGTEIFCRAVVVAAGVYLKSRILVGEYERESGPAGLLSSRALALNELGFELRRFKTGTPPRIDGKTVDYSLMEIQNGDSPKPKFSFMNKASYEDQIPCYLTYTNADTHDVILANLDRSPMYSGKIKATGTRYCPSIEDKLMRFKDKDKHQLFIEFEGKSTNEVYLQGLSTSLPRDVQTAMINTILGLERARITRFGYAIEYDCIDPLSLSPSLMAKSIDGLFFAGQINGTSGYEEAAAQGLIAGINAAMYVKNEPPVIMSRADSYIGVLIDDLTSKGTNEPYRMMTSRAEYRLILRQDNADLRLTERFLRTGLIDEKRLNMVVKKRIDIEKAMKAVAKVAHANDSLTALLGSAARPGLTMYDCLKREGVSYEALKKIYPELPDISNEAAEQLKISIYYEGYIDKQKKQLERQRELESMEIPAEIDYMSINALRIEARQKLTSIRPGTIAQATQISGVSPADIAVLMVKVKGL
ncbi:MAG: tRNA uridine-5-carboxymethylaminomethyl(34) synthesis enzyme MnmG [Clostridia bacterium]